MGPCCSKNHKVNKRGDNKKEKQIDPKLSTKNQSDKENKQISQSVNQDSIQKPLNSNEVTSVTDPNTNPPNNQKENNRYIVKREEDLLISEKYEEEERQEQRLRRKEEVW